MGLPRYLSDLRGTLLSVFGLKPAGTTGAPSSGTYNLGELYLDSAGVYWVCTVAGSPGTWEEFGANVWPKPGKFNIGTTEYPTLAAAVAVVGPGESIYA